MSEQALFSGIAAGTVVRLFLFDGLSTFGVVHRRHPHHFVVRPVGFPYVAEERFRYDGLMDGGRDAPQIVFFLTPEEEQSPLIQEYKNILKEQYEINQKQWSLWTNIRNAQLTEKEDN